MIAGAILSAGRSSRMGRAKALLTLGPDGPTFLAHIAATFGAAGIAETLVVGRATDSDVTGEAVRLGLRFVDSPHADEGQIASIVAAVDAVDDDGATGLLVLPVDQPLVRVSSVTTLLDVATRHPDAIVRATCGGRHGHPVIFPRATFDALRHADRRIGARAVVRDPATHVIDVDVADEGTIADFDTPEDYARTFGQS